MTNKPVGHSACTYTLSSHLIYGGVLQKKKGQHLYCCRDCVTRGPVYRLKKFYDIFETGCRAPHIVLAGDMAPASMRLVTLAVQLMS